MSVRLDFLSFITQVMNFNEKNNSILTKYEDIDNENLSMTLKLVKNYNVK